MGNNDLGNLLHKLVQALHIRIEIILRDQVGEILPVNVVQYGNMRTKIPERNVALIFTAGLLMTFVATRKSRV